MLRRGWLRLRGRRSAEPVIGLLCPKKLSRLLPHAPSPSLGPGSGCGFKRWGGQGRAESKPRSPAALLRLQPRHRQVPAHPAAGAPGGLTHPHVICFSCRVLQRGRESCTEMATCRFLLLQQTCAASRALGSSRQPLLPLCAPQTRRGSRLPQQELGQGLGRDPSLPAHPQLRPRAAQGRGGGDGRALRCFPALPKSAGVQGIALNAAGVGPGSVTAEGWRELGAARWRPGRAGCASAGETQRCSRRPPGSQGPVFLALSGVGSVGVQHAGPCAHGHTRAPSWQALS